jgi:hypothetical protein
MRLILNGVIFCPGYFLTTVETHRSRSGEMLRLLNLHWVVCAVVKHASTRREYYRDKYNKMNEWERLARITSSPDAWYIGYLASMLSNLTQTRPSS